MFQVQPQGHGGSEMQQRSSCPEGACQVSVVRCASVSEPVLSHSVQQEPECGSQHPGGILELVGGGFASNRF